MNSAILTAIGDLRTLLDELASSIGTADVPPMQAARLLIELDRGRAQLSRCASPIVEGARWAIEHPEAVRER